MTDKDKYLIAQAEKLHFFDWGRAFDLMKEAESEEARYRLKSIGRALYHKDERYAGLL